MKDIYLIKYAVKGIKTIDEWASMSFYNKTITKQFNIRGYNIKGIYGMNGSGKSGIMISLKILKGLLLDDNYLSNPVVQRHLDELVNKRLGKLEYDVEYILKTKEKIWLYNYKISLAKDSRNRFVISSESLAVKNASSHSDTVNVLFSIENGEIIELPLEGTQKELVVEQTRNLLSDVSFTGALVIRKGILRLPLLKGSKWMHDLIVLCFFGLSLYVYLDTEDDHTYYVINDLFSHTDTLQNAADLDSLFQYSDRLERMHPFFLTAETMSVAKENYEDFEKKVHQLTRFLQIFKYDLKGIGIDRKESKTAYVCDLIMNYDDYNINAEFESTGIKKLIRLFAYFQKMVEGNIVFIDELDSNLHDVYLCALLEYLMAYGHGQLCFTTHNIGPMDILKKNKKSIDFLSVDHKIYSWKTSGNYSPSKLYRQGMIEGSPFNVDAIDFIGAFGADEEVD